ncbi:lysM domain receptor-like kinase 4 [Ancistrocladus abbreviatus]
MLVYAVIGAVAGVGIVLVIGVTAYCVFSRKTNNTSDIFIPAETFEAYENPIWKKSEVECQKSLQNLPSVAQSLKVYSFTDLQSATDDFSPSCLIAGTVFRGRINGDLAAIKRMKSDVSNEVNLLSKVHHFNLLRVLGVCFNDGQCYLIYEYAANGPLCDWIHCKDTDNPKFLGWTRRMQFVLDVAKGLNYIHSLFSPPHVHKEITSSNILLDGDYRAKITKFSLTRSNEDKDGIFITSQVVPLKNHLSPEYLENGVVSPKLDVFAFGILMLEMLTGKQVADLYERVNVDLSEALADLLCEEDGKECLRSLMDPSLKGNYPSDLAISVAGLIDNCLEKDPSGRPTMDEIVWSLSKVLTASLSWESSI